MMARSSSRVFEGFIPRERDKDSERHLQLSPVSAVLLIYVGIRRNGQYESSIRHRMGPLDELKEGNKKKVTVGDL